MGLDHPRRCVPDAQSPGRGFIDGLLYDGRHPNAYLQQFAIGLKGDERVQ